MKKTLTAIALFAALTTGISSANAYGPGPAHMGSNEGLQNYYYYFGAPCCDRPLAMAAPCAAPAPCGGPCMACPCQYAPVQYELYCRSECDGGLFGIFL
jgi:hypothetical protein